MADYRSALGRARGLGSAGRGVGHFIGQRVSAVALIVLVGWALWSALILARGDYGTAAAWLRSPIDLALAALLAIAGFWHMQIGMGVIIEDYIAAKGARATLLIGNFFVCFAGAVLTFLCLLKVALGGGGAV
jgi:succinate dehydrogenase / fumarate reductase membrane anchor subunit